MRTSHVLLGAIMFSSFVATTASAEMLPCVGTTQEDGSILATCAFSSAKITFVIPRDLAEGKEGNFEVDTAAWARIGADPTPIGSIEKNS